MSTHPHHHSLEGNNPLRGTDYIEHAPSTNQGIVDGRPGGRQPPSSAALLDTVVDEDASADDQTDHLTAQDTVVSGATSQDVYAGLGVPLQGMSASELRHDGQHARKRQGAGTEQYGQGEAGGSDRGDGARRLDGASERRWVAGKTEFRENP